MFTQIKTMLNKSKKKHNTEELRILKGKYKKPLTLFETIKYVHRHL